MGKSLHKVFKTVVLAPYVADGHIAIASEYGHDIYATALEKLSSNTTSYEDIIFLFLGTYTRYSF